MLENFLWIWHVMKYIDKTRLLTINKKDYIDWTRLLTIKQNLLWVWVWVWSVKEERL